MHVRRLGGLGCGGARRARSVDKKVLDWIGLHSRRDVNQEGTLAALDEGVWREMSLEVVAHGDLVDGDDVLDVIDVGVVSEHDGS